MTTRFNFYAGVFLVTLSMLMVEVIQTRLLSVMAWYYMAFFIISLAMFGLTAGSVWVYLKGDRFSQDNLSYSLTVYTTGFAGSTVLCLLIQMTLPLTNMMTATALFAWIQLVLCISIPFFLAGVVVSLVLTRSPFPIGYVYAVDLVGAAAGCLAVLLLLNTVDGPSALLTAALVASLSAVFFSYSAIGFWPQQRRGLARIFGRPIPCMVLLGVLLSANLSTDKGIHPLFVKDNIERRNNNLLFEQWNSYSRVTVYNRGVRTAHLWGPSNTFPQIQKEWRILNIDGAAGSPLYRFQGDENELEFLKYDITNLAYSLQHTGKAAIIGIGGGRDILSAWYYGFRDITGIELNSIIVNLLTNNPSFADFTHLNRLPGVRFVADEARSWFSRHEDAFDLIQMSMIDTWAATGAGAFSLSENGLYTVEAWTLFLRHLAPHGVFTVSRWHAAGEINETGRMVSLAVAALMELGVAEPRNHLFLATVRNRLATLVVSRSPLGDDAVQQLEKAAAEMEFIIIHSPTKPTPSKVLNRILHAENRSSLDAYTATLDLNLTPPTDNSPFFFNQLPFHKPDVLLNFLLHNWSGKRVHAVNEGVVFGNLLATRTLIFIVLISLVLVAATLIIPLLPALKETLPSLVVGGTAYFSLIGMGFMFVEMAFLQRLNVFLGHPTYSLSVVLFSLILSTGFGSWLSERYPLNTLTKRIFWVVLLCLYLLALAYSLPYVFLSLRTATMLIRCMGAAGFILPAGILMGFAFPSGMKLVEAIDNKPAPWFWGMNGAAGVLSSSVAVVISIALGIHWNFLLGAVCYLLLIPASMLMQIGYRREE